MTSSAPKPLVGPTHVVDIVFPGSTNHHGTLFGGAALSYMDEVAFVAASRYGRCSFVTASCERVDFAAAAARGNIIDFEARVVKVGRRSLVVEVDMHAEDLLTGEKKLCTRGQFNMVCPDKAVPPFPPLTEAVETGTPDAVLCANVEMVFADQTNHYGTLFGGNALAMMGKTAFITATRHSRKVFVMASSQRTDFVGPAKEGEIIDLAGRVKYVGTSSLVTEIIVHAEDLLSGDRRLVAKSEFVMVAVDKNGKPEAI